MRFYRPLFNKFRWNCNLLFLWESNSWSIFVSFNRLHQGSPLFTFTFFLISLDYALSPVLIITAWFPWLLDARSQRWLPLYADPKAGPRTVHGRKHAWFLCRAQLLTRSGESCQRGLHGSWVVYIIQIWRSLFLLVLLWATLRGDNFVQAVHTLSQIM